MHKFVILRIYSISSHIAVIYSHKNSQPPAGAKVGLCRITGISPRLQLLSWVAETARYENNVFFL